MTASPHWIYGADTPEPEPITLRMGAVSLFFEPHSGWVRTVKLNQGAEIVRGIYIAVRDKNWNTIPVTISDLEIQHKRGGFQISYSAAYRQDDIHFTYTANLIGTPDGTLTYSLRGKAHTSFLKNRIGFCVLHPADECAGKNVTVEHTDGTTTHGNFPSWISPHQPFENIRTVTTDVLWGVKAKISFEGDVFEMEDQRNWTDASFKTYSTPLSEPYPVEIAAGTVITQAVTLELSGRIPDRAAETQNALSVIHQASEKTYSLPDFGMRLAPLQKPLTEGETARIAALNLSHLRVDIDFAHPNWRDIFLQTLLHLDNARLNEISLETALSFTDKYQVETEALAAIVRQLPRRTVKRWLVSQKGASVTPENVVIAARAALDKYQHRADFYAGTDADFTELNRNRPADSRYFHYSLNPQVHAFDTRSLMETLVMQGDTVRNTKRFGKNPFVAVSPITLTPRPNPNATSGENSVSSDARQYALVGAAWTLGSIASLVEGGTHSATYYELFGSSGVMENESESGSRVAPAYHVLADVGELANGRYVQVGATNRRDEAAVLFLHKREKRRLMVANLTPTTQEFEVDFPARRIMLKILDETTLERAMTEPEAYRAEAGQSLRGKTGTDWRGFETRRVRITLRPYGIARLDGEYAE